VRGDVGLLPVPLSVCMIRVGTGCPPYGHRYRRVHTNPLPPI